MKFYKRISVKITLSLFVLMVLTGIFHYFHIFAQVNQYTVELTQKHIFMLEQSIFNNLRVSMNTGNQEDIEKVITQANNIQGVQKLAIFKNPHFFQTQSKEFHFNPTIAGVMHSKQSKTNIHTQNDSKILQISTPILIQKECMACHTNTQENDVIGVFDFYYSLDESQGTIQNLLLQTSLYGLLLAAFTVFIIYWIVNRATHPIEGLKNGFQRLLKDSSTHTKLTARANDEIADVIQLFNQYVDKINDDLKHEAENFAHNIINSQSNIIITNNKDHKLESVNDAFLKFFEVNSIEEFQKKYGECICDTFKNTDEPNYITKDMTGIYWRDYILQTPNSIHKVLIEKGNKEYTFTITLEEFSIGEDIFRTAVFTDITEIISSQTKLKELLNNADQGFLYFDHNMIIGLEYSKQASEIFGIDLANKDITTLLFPTNEEESNYLKNTLQSVLDLEESQREMIFSLLQNEFILNGKSIEIEYKYIGNKNFMLLLSDVTKQKRLDQKLQKEQQILKMVVETVTTLEQFEEIRIAFEHFCNKIEQYKSLEKLFELRREIHTFKGLFAQKEMLNIVNNLHDLETIIDNSIKDNELDPTIIHITGDIIYSWLEDDIRILKGILGDEFFHKTEYLTIKQERIEKIYSKLIQLCNSDEKMNILKDVKELLYKDIKVYIKPFKHTVDNLAQKLDKPIYPLQINAENIFVPQKYKFFLNSLVHVFRNALDHGIEDVETRIVNNKPKLATIKCTIKKENDDLIIIISDDGAGLDIEAIKAKAIEKNIYSIEELDSKTDKECAYIILEDEFSTAKNITNISGRGVGLASTKYEVEKLGGEIEILSKQGYGVTFIFTIPFKQ